MIRNIIYFVVMVVFAKSVLVGQSDSVLYYEKLCGLKMTQTSVVLSTRATGIDASGVQPQPAQFSVSDLPASATVRRAFLFWSVVSARTFSNDTVEVTSPTNQTIQFIGRVIGRSDGVSGTTIFTNESAFTVMADVTQSITSRGAYFIAGFPSSLDTLAPEAIGATLVVIYQVQSLTEKTIITISTGGVAKKVSDTVNFSFDVDESRRSCLGRDKVFAILAGLHKSRGDTVGLMFGSNSTVVDPVRLHSWLEVESPTNPAKTYSFVNNKSSSYFVLVRGFITTCIVPVPTAIAGPDRTICRRESTQLGTTSQVNYLYRWFPEVGLDDPAISNPKATPDTTTLYHLTVTDSTGCDTRFDSVLVTVRPRVFPKTSNGFEICIGDTGLLSGSATGGNPPYSYLWSPTGFAQNPTNSTSNVFPSVTTDFILRVTDASGCSEEDTVRVVVNNLPDASAGADRGMCALTPIQLQATGGVLYKWSANQWLESTDIPNPNLKAITPIGRHTFSVLVTDSKGCEKRDDITITVTAIPILNVISEDESIDFCPCVGKTIICTLAPPYRYRWNTGDTTRSVRATRSGTYTVTAFDSNNCSASASMVVNAINSFSSARLQPSVDSAFAGDHVNLSVVLDSSNALERCHSDTFSFSFNYPRTLMVPAKVQPRISITKDVIRGDRRYISVKNSRRDSLGDIGSIDMIMTLGYQLSGEIKVDSLQWTPCFTSSSTLSSGNLSLAGVCKSGGARVFYNPEVVRSMYLFPNPAFSELTLGLVDDLSLKGLELVVLTSVGELVEIHRITEETDQYKFDVSRFPTGIYQLQLRSEKETISELNVVVVR